MTDSTEKVTPNEKDIIQNARDLLPNFLMPARTNDLHFSVKWLSIVALSFETKSCSLGSRKDSKRIFNLDGIGRLPLNHGKCGCLPWNLCKVVIKKKTTTAYIYIIYVIYIRTNSLRRVKLCSVFVCQL